MKIILSFLITLISINIINGCTQYQCLNEGDFCNKPGRYCSGDLYCNVAYDDPICEPMLKLYDTCKYAEQCGYGLYCLNTGDDQYCANVRYKGPGETCKKDLECSENLKCNVTCIYQGLECTSKSCKAGQFCNSETQTCQSVFADGSQCTSNSQCKANSRCLITSNASVSKCTPLNSLAEGLPCNSIDACDIGSNLVCYNGYCTLQSSIKNQNSTCSSSKQCQMDAETCLCDSINKPNGSGTCTQSSNIGSNCKNAKLKYFNCLTTSNCPLESSVTNPYSSSSCMQSKCGQLKCSYESECINSDFSCGIGSVCSNSSISIINYSIYLILLSILISII